MTTRATKVKTTWSHRVSKVIARIFSIIKGIIKALWEVVEHCLETVTFFFGLLVRVVANPTRGKSSEAVTSRHENAETFVPYWL